MRIIRLTLLLALTLTACRHEHAQAWTSLFDGHSFAGWRGVGLDSVPPGWTIEDGALHKLASGAVPRAPDGQPLEGGDLMTVGTYRNFELELEWKISPGGNSGIKYNVSEAMSTASPPGHAALGFEYQVLDDDRRRLPPLLVRVMQGEVAPDAARQERLNQV